MEKKSIVRFATEELKREAYIQGMQLANSCLEETKKAVANIAKRETEILFDRFIDWLNKR